MKYTNSIRFKAFILLLVFSLNTVVGVACAMGVNIRFNLSHSKTETQKPSVHIHADGKKHHHQKPPVHKHAKGTIHHHQEQPVKNSVHVHANGKKHEHTTLSAKKDVSGESTKKDNDDCCNNDVLKFQDLDKRIVQQAKFAANAPVLVAIMSIFTGMDILSLSKSYPPKFKARLFYPPPPDIRIAIQSFQI